jgi:hypothetical protein
VPEQIAETRPRSTTQSGGGSGLKAAAAAAAAAGAAAIIARKALSSDGGGTNGRRSSNGGGSSKSSRETGTMFGSIASGGWDAARDALGPAAEDAAAAVGKFVAENAPDIVRERIVPRFIESFNEARRT